jgi:hypothetical protein
MNDRPSPTATFARAGILLAAGIAGIATAQTYPKEGNYEFSSCWSGVSSMIAFDKSHVAYSFEMTGTTQTTPPGGAFDKLTFRCVGMNYVLEGTPLKGTTVCEAVDAQGDKSLTHFTTEGTRGARTAVVGTGKYEGMVSTGTTAPVGVFPVIKPGTFQNCNRQTGTYKMK